MNNNPIQPNKKNVGIDIIFLQPYENKLDDFINFRVNSLQQVCVAAFSMDNHQPIAMINHSIQNKLVKAKQFDILNEDFLHDLDEISPPSGRTSSQHKLILSLNKKKRF